jgi:hypothetical protein
MAAAATGNQGFCNAVFKVRASARLLGGEGRQLARQALMGVDRTELGRGAARRVSQ